MIIITCFVVLLCCRSNDMQIYISDQKKDIITPSSLVQSFAPSHRSCLRRTSFTTNHILTVKLSIETLQKVLLQLQNFSFRARPSIHQKHLKTRLFIEETRIEKQKSIRKWIPLKAMIFGRDSQSTAVISTCSSIVLDYMAESHFCGQIVDFSGKSPTANYCVTQSSHFSISGLVYFLLFSPSLSFSVLSTSIFFFLSLHRVSGKRNYK